MISKPWYCLRCPCHCRTFWATRTDICALTTRHSCTWGVLCSCTHLLCHSHRHTCPHSCSTSGTPPKSNSSSLHSSVATNGRKKMNHVFVNTNRKKTRAFLKDDLMQKFWYLKFDFWKKNFLLDVKYMKEILLKCLVCAFSTNFGVCRFILV